jgi:predicted Zn-dependent protease
MRIKKAVTKGLLIAFALTLIPVTAVSAQKITPGSTCKVLNKKVVYQNKTYTCTKSGNKLVWNKGVTAKKPTPTPTLTPTKPPTSTEQNDVRTLIVHYKRANGDYKDWNLWLWKDVDGQEGDEPLNLKGTYFDATDKFGVYVKIEISKLKNFKNIGLIVRKGNWVENDINFDRFIPLTNHGKVLEIWLMQDDAKVYLNEPNLETPSPNLNQRVSFDRIDDVSGPQVKAYYVVPSDGQDQERDINGDIENYLNVAKSYFFDQIQKTLRIDTFNEKYDIQFIKSQMKSSSFNSTAQDISLGSEIGVEYNQSLTSKIHVFFLESKSSLGCGYASAPSNLVVVVVSDECLPNQPYLQFRQRGGLALAHELGHAFGLWHIQDFVLSPEKVDLCDLMAGPPSDDCEKSGRTMDKKREWYVLSTNNPLKIDITKSPYWVNR